MNYPTKKFFEAQHKEATLKINGMIDRMGESEFIDFFQTVYRFVNRKEVDVDTVKSMFTKCPKMMCIYIQIAQSEMDRKGIKYG